MARLGQQQVLTEDMVLFNEGLAVYETIPLDDRRRGLVGAEYDRLTIEQHWKQGAALQWCLMRFGVIPRPVALLDQMASEYDDIMKSQELLGK